MFQQIKLLILPCYSSCQPMKLISNLSAHAIIIKSLEKIKPVKWCFLDFNLDDQNFTECKDVKFQHTLILHMVLVCAGMDFDDIMHMDFFLSLYRFS